MTVDYFVDTEQPGWWSHVFSEEEREVYERLRERRPTQFPWDSCALLVVDATQAFLGANVPTVEASREIRTACGAPAWKAVGPISALLLDFRARELPVIYTRQNWLDMSHFGGVTKGSSDGTKIEDRFPDALAPRDQELVLAKTKASAFFGTGLAPYLVRHRISGLVVVGGTTSGCVRATVIDAISFCFESVVVYDACFDRSMLSHAVALQELDVKYAHLLSSRDVASALSRMFST